MYKPNKVFPLQLKDDVKIWRYMDFTKLVSLIDSKKIYLSRADKLGDKFEGSFSKLNVKKRPIIYGDNTLLIKNLESIHKNLPRWVYLNCWNISNGESAAMWKLYSRYGYGIAIQSTIGRLKKCFDNAEQILTISKVRYVSYKDFFIPEGNLLAPFFHKRRSYTHERELRVAHMLDFEKGGDVDLSLETPPGIFIPIDIELLIKRIYVAPETSNWVKELINSILNKYNYKFKLKQSSLDDDPIY